MKHLDSVIDDLAQKLNISKSKLIERAIKKFITNQLEYEGKALSKIKFEDLPSEDEWMAIQSQIED